MLTFIDFVGYHGVVKSWQFYVWMPIMVYIFEMMVLGLMNVHFWRVILKVNSYNKNWNYLVIFLTSINVILSIIFYMILDIFKSKYEPISASFVKASLISAAIFLALTIFVFILRIIQVFKIIVEIQGSNSSDNESSKRVQYLAIFIWSLITIIGYFFIFLGSIFLVSDKFIFPRSVTVLYAFLFFGCALSSLGIIFLFKLPGSTKESGSFRATSPERNEMTSPERNDN